MIFKLNVLAKKNNLILGQKGPKFKKTVRTAKEVDDLIIPDPQKDLGYVMDAVSTIRKELNGRVPLIGFSGSPWTLATYMVEGGSSKDFRMAKALAFNEPEVMHKLLDKLAQSVTSYLNAQIKAGAQTIKLIFHTSRQPRGKVNRVFSTG